MAGDWLKVETATPDKPEILQMAHELNLDPDAVFGKVYRVWVWFDSHSEDGNAPSVTEMLLDRQVGVTGFVQSMVNVGWMQKEEDFISVPNFDSHNGQSAKKRANTARRVAKSRKCNGDSNDNCNEDVTPEALHKALAREEKRREENKDIKDKPAAKFNFKNSLIDLGVDKQVASDWMSVRKTKRCANTETAFKNIKTQIEKSNLSANESITLAVEKSWGGFEASWVKTEEKPRGLKW